MKEENIGTAAKIAEGIYGIVDLLPWIIGFLFLAIIGNLGWLIYFLLY